MKFYSSRDHRRVKTGNSRKKWLLGGWFITGKDCNFHKTRRNNRVYRTFSAKRESSLDDDFEVNEKPNIIPVDLRYKVFQRVIGHNILWYNTLDSTVTTHFGHIVSKYRMCSLCALLTINTRNCEECGGVYSLCSSHKGFRGLCHICGLKCRACKEISSMRFDNPSNLNSVSFSSFGSSKRTIIGRFNTIDICQSCDDVIVERIQDLNIVKDLGKMIVGYAKE